MKSGGYKWIVLALLGGAYFFHQADRALFGLLTVPIQGELGLTDLQIGWINTALSWTIAVVTFAAGFLGDRFSRKRIITASLAFWSLATVCMGFAGEWRIAGIVFSSFAVVMFLRSLATGGGESFYGPSAMSMLAAYHVKTRSLAFSVHQAALYFGLMTSGLLCAWALGLLGTWRRVFMAFGGAGLLLALVFTRALREPADDLTCRSGRGVSAVAALKSFFLNPSALLATSGFVAIVFVNNAYLFWAPKFLFAKFGVSVEKAGTATMLYHHLFAFAAILAGGAVTDRFVRRLPRFRLGFQIVSLLLGAPCLALVGLCPSVAATIAATAAYGVFRGCFEVNTHASVFDVIPAGIRASAVGFMLLMAFLVGGLSGVFMGALSDLYGVRGFEIGFVAMGGAYLLAAALMSVSFFFTFRRDRLRAEEK